VPSTVKGILMSKIISIFVALAGVALSGCGTIDPWSEMSKTPPSRSALFGVPSPGGATSQPLADLSGRTLTLAECIRVALERNPRTAASWQAARAAAARVGQSKSEYFPTVGFGTDATRANPAELDDKADSGTQNTFNALFGVRYLLFDGGGREARLMAAKEDLLAANFRHNTVLQDVALAAEEAYYELLAARQLRDVAQETVKQTGQHVALAEARHKVGVAAKSDVLQAQTEKADADLSLVRADSAVRVGKGRLANALGLRVSQTVEIAQPQLPQDIHRLELADIEQLLDEAAATRPELKAALAQVEVQRAAVKSAEARYWPSVTAGADAGWIGRTFPPNLSQWNLGLGVDWALFTGFDRNYQVHRSKSDLARSIAERESLLQGVELEVWTAYQRVIEASQAIDAAGRFVASAEENARVAEGEYKNGVGSIIALIDAQTAHSTARTQLVRAQLDWYTAMARFERAIGRTLARGSEVAVSGKVKS
jgi:outer membrane protein TolC